MDLNEKNAAARAGVLGAYQGACDGVASQLESPIEVAVFWALLEYGAEWGQPRVEFCSPGQSWFIIPTETESLFIAPQAATVANGRSYRADFVVEVDRTGGASLCGRTWSTFKTVVECDGHDFHERTKEQAARDRRRDRDFQAAGYTVLRFTGSEIARDPKKVAEEIVRSLNDRAMAEWQRWYDEHAPDGEVPPRA